MPDLNNLEQIIQLAELDLQKFESRHSGFPKSDEHIDKAKQIICGAKKLLEVLREESC